MYIKVKERHSGDIIVKKFKGMSKPFDMVLSKKSFTSNADCKYKLKQIINRFKPDNIRVYIIVRFDEHK